MRVAATDDLQGPAIADYLYTKLGKKTVFIVDDTETYGAGLADTFEAKFKELGGTVAARQGVTNSDGSADYTSILTAAQGANPEAVMYGGVTSTGGAKLRTQMADVGMGDLPFVGGDGIVDGNGSTEGGYINLAGRGRRNVYGTVAGDPRPPRASTSPRSTRRVRQGSGCLQRPGLRLHPDHPEGDRGERVRRVRHGALREAVRAYVIDSATSTTRSSARSRSRERRHQAGDHLVLQGRSCRGRRKGGWVFD